MSRTKAELAVVILVLIALGSMLSIAVSRARTAARKMSSQNNLKQIGLAVHNFESTFRKLPPGCDEKASHGWMSFIFPYMEASAWYSNLDRDISWEHPLNHHQFTTCVRSYCMPGHETNFTKEGFGITSYHASTALLYRGSAVKFSDLTAGLSNIWLAGEINGDYTPFGYPFNWRELDKPINEGPKSFGGWKDGANFVLADASIKFIDNGISPTALQQLATAAPLPAKSLYESPDRRFALAPHRKDSCVRFVGAEDRGVKGGPPYSEVWYEVTGQPEFIDFVHGLVEVEHVIKKHPQAKILRVAYPQDVQELELICGQQELEILCLMSEFELPNRPKPIQLELSKLVNGLQQLPKLTFLKLQINEDDLVEVRKELPNCLVIPSEQAPHTFRR